MVNSGNQDVYVPETARIVRSAQMTNLEKYFEIKLESGKSLGHTPGQFVEVSLPGIGEAPISVSSAPSDNGSFELVVRKVGRLTDVMHDLPDNSRIGIRGPFGTSFPVTDELQGKDVAFICGGIGLVPVRSAINYVLQNRDDYGKVSILYGTKTPADRLFTDELDKWGADSDIDFHETVDRADSEWRGNVGVITTLIPKLDLDPANTKVIVCGPPVMYKFVLIELAEHNISEENTYVSLERRMKCGVGKCGHCQINGYYTCLEGPVFKYSDISDVQEAI